MILVNVLAGVLAMLILAAYAAIYGARRFHTESKDELVDLRAKLEASQHKVHRLTPPDDEFHLTWMRNDLTDAQFKDVVRYLVKRDETKVSWSAEWLTLDPQLESRSLKVHICDKAEGMLFKLTWGGAL